MAAVEISLDEFIGILDRMPLAVKAAGKLALERGSRRIVKEAQHRIGTYQEAEGPFAAWAELAEATKEQRVAQGYSENDPLLRSGALRDAIEYTVLTKGFEHEAVIGVKHAMVDDPATGKAVDIGMVAAVQELGDARVPPRSFIGGAGYHMAPVVRDIVGHAIEAAISGKPVGNR